MLFDIYFVFAVVSFYDSDIVSQMKYIVLVRPNYLLIITADRVFAVSYFPVRLFSSIVEFI